MRLLLVTLTVILFLVLASSLYSYCMQAVLPIEVDSRQVSDYTWTGENIEDLIELLCDRQEVDFTGDWLFTCPACRDTDHAVWSQIEGVSIVMNFGSDVESPDAIYCRGCSYPLGVDWQLERYEDDSVSFGELTSVEPVTYRTEVSLFNTDGKQVRTESTFRSGICGETLIEYKECVVK